MRKLTKREVRLKLNQLPKPKVSIESDCKNFSKDKEGEMYCTYYGIKILDTSIACWEGCLGRE